MPPVTRTPMVLEISHRDLPNRVGRGGVCAPDLHRPRIHITTPTGRYDKLVPGVRTTTKAEALTSAQKYREAILASGQLSPKGERKSKTA
jgi:hypothetical protein